ncbi:response regulator [Coprothermobacteraceae bacterium]|nr:response regulator [Coprothermobacteraceae bacterium]
MITKTVLVLSKLPKNVELMGQVLSRYDLEVVSATSYEDLRRLIDADAFDAAVLDIGGFDSRIWAFCDELREKHRPFVLISPTPNRDFMSHGFSKGARSVLTKPIESKSFVAIVMEMLGGDDSFGED